MADRLAFHVLTGKLDENGKAAVREAEQALLKAAAALEQSENTRNAA